MKKIKKALLCLFMLASPFVLAGCQSNGIDKKDITGTQEESLGEINNGSTNKPDKSGDNEKLTSAPTNKNDKDPSAKYKKDIGPIIDDREEDDEEYEGFYGSVTRKTLIPRVSDVFIYDSEGKYRGGVQNGVGDDSSEGYVLAGCGEKYNKLYLPGDGSYTVLIKPRVDSRVYAFIEEYDSSMGENRRKVKFKKLPAKEDELFYKGRQQENLGF